MNISQLKSIYCKLTFRINYRIIYQKISLNLAILVGILTQNLFQIREL